MPNPAAVQGHIPKRHQKGKKLKEDMSGITKPSIRRLARRAGVKRINGLIYEDVGVWELEVNRPDGRLRAARLCKLCDTNAVEDELHVFGECPCYAALRAEFEESVGFSRGDMRLAMTTSPPIEVGPVPTACLGDQV